MAQGAPGVKLTYRELSQWPDDGRRHELIDGEHFVTASPSLDHQVVLRELLTELTLYFRRTRSGRAFPAPLDVVLTDFDVVEPDIVVVLDPITDRRAEAVVRGAPDLIIEILSPSTEARDRGLKRHLYERFGVPEYWLVNPDRRTVEVLRRSGEALATAADLGEGDTLTTPLLPGLDIAIEQLFGV